MKPTDKALAYYHSILDSCQTPSTSKELMQALHNGVKTTKLYDVVRYFVENGYLKEIGLQNTSHGKKLSIYKTVIDTYDDHRMAMCFSLVALGGVPVIINDPKCVNKTFPDYFNSFAQVVKA